jgi:hypothetical protein
VTITRSQAETLLAALAVAQEREKSLAESLSHSTYDPEDIRQCGLARERTRRYETLARVIEGNLRRRETRI